MPLQRIYRVATYVPAECVDAVLDGVCRITPLRYGKYDRSAWWISGGTEQFEPGEGASPSHGEVGKVSRVATTRLEFCLPLEQTLLRHVIDVGIRPNHPWEEPAIFVDEVLADIRG
jgi:hypothetical protein